MTNLSLSFSDLCCRSTLRLALALGVAVLLAGCEEAAEKVAPADDTSSSDTAADASDSGSDTADSTGGEVTEDTAPDGADTAPDTAPDTAVDTGTAPTCDEQLGLLPSTDCGCGGQLICRDQAAAPVCVGALPENACGGCGGIAVEIGAGCGLCGDGVWTCDAANPDVPNCVGATPQNSCGGCTALPGIEGDSCSADGFFLCATEDELVCVGPGQNACGGFAALGDALGGPCGECGAGRFVCDGVDAVRCEEAVEPRNACGGCGTLPNRVGDACGDCDGTWACDPSNNDGLVCSQTRNVCGSCGSAGAGGLGEACTGGRLVCGVDGQLSCESNDRNLCGGTAALSDEPGTGCGSCGGVNICAGPDRVVCIGSSPVNGCGGCGFLPGFPGTFCGVDHTWECNGEGTMACEQTTASVVVSDAVGGTTTVDKGQVTVPSGAVSDPLRITIRVRNGLVIPGYELTSPVLEFGPSGTEFAQPLEVQIISDDAPASDMVWSNRPAEGGGYSEVPGATVAGDALVGEVSHFSVGFTGIPIPDTELCGDGTDNDGDGLTDCEDSDCALVAGCAVSDTELDCTNGIDDDGDLLTDCDDSDCVGGPGCADLGPEVCDDGVDNDGNGLADCDDPACAGPLCSPRTERCDNAIDDDLDGRTDCADSDCVGDAACTSGGPEVCDDGIDNDADGWVDCYDWDCDAAGATGACAQVVSNPLSCAAGTRYQSEVIVEGVERGLCIPVVGAGASCGASQVCDETLNLVCGALGSCRAAVQAEGCASSLPLTANPGTEGPDYYAVDRLDGLTAVDESLNCTGTVGAEKVYFYTATSPVELNIVVGATDGNGPEIAWYARTGSCSDIFAEVACGNARLAPTSGDLQLAAGETAYIIVDSAARWAGGNSAAAEFFVEVRESPLAALGESCDAAICEAGLTCSAGLLCVVTVCGDGEVAPTEACDDGNGVAGDGCTACLVDVFNEVEPNDDDATANAAGGARLIRGQSAASFPGDFDVFCVATGPSGGLVEVRPRVTTGAELYFIRAPFDDFSGLVNLTVNGSSGVFETSASSFCFYLAGVYGAVTYTVEVLFVQPPVTIAEHGVCGDASGVAGACADIGGVPAICRQPDLLRRVGTCELSRCGDGFVDEAAGERCDDANLVDGDGCSASCASEPYAEVEPNNGTLTARNLGSFREVSGDISAATDADYFKVTLARRSHLEFEADSSVFARDTRSLNIQLLSSTGAELFSGGIDTYSGVSGGRYGQFAGDTGFLQDYDSLAFLEPGTYTFRVSSSSATGAYTLFVRELGSSVVPEGGACDPTAYLPCSEGLACSALTETCQPALCGNGDVTVGEGCDDGNAIDGDGCSAACTIEVLSPALLATTPDPLAPPPAGARFFFPDGSEAEVYEFDFPFCDCSQSFYVSLHIDGNSRVRTFNVGSAARIWKVGTASPYSVVGTQVAAPSTALNPRPRWLSQAPRLRAQTCYGNTANGVCEGIADGQDCFDCGVRYGDTAPSDEGIDVRLVPGDYVIEVSSLYGGMSSIVVGESPSERAQ